MSEITNTKVLEGEVISTTKPQTKRQQPRMRDLPLKQRKFIKYYRETGNGKQSAIRAGYSENGAAVTASRLLTKPKVLAILNDSVEEAELVIKELLHSRDEDVRLKAAKETLDRTIGKPVARTENVSVNITVEHMLSE